MGIDLKNRKRNLRMSYITFGLLRQCVAYSYNQEMGLLYRKWYNTSITGGLTQQEVDRYNELNNSDLDILLLHSDCDGRLTRKECKKIYNVIKDIKFDLFPNWEREDLYERFEELKQMLKDNYTIYFY